MRAVRSVLCLLASVSISLGAFAKDSAGTLEPDEDEPYVLKAPLQPGKFDEDEPEAFDISGIACRPPVAGKALHCLVVDDEGAQAQRIKIKGRTIKPGKTIALAADKTLGEPPANRACTPPKKGKAASNEFDGEGVAYADGFYYVVGSHGCGRKHGVFKPSSLRLARIPVDADGEPDEDGIVATYRLAGMLAKAPTVGDFFLKPLTTENGLNIEGVAVVGERLYAGLRAPSLGGKAFLVGVPLDTLFADGEPEMPADPEVIALEVGPGAGIRDLAALDDGRLLVLTGPAQEQPDVGYGLFIADLPGGRTTSLGTLKSLKGRDRCGKAEAVAVLDRHTVLVLFDSLASGGPRSYAVPVSLGKPR